VQLNDEAKQLLTSYSFPGNVRELKNLAEQISVLSTDKLINANQLQQFLPNGQFTRTPMLANNANSGGEFANEREILYKLFFDMKKDVTELKKMFFDLLQNPTATSHAPVFTPDQVFNSNYDLTNGAVAPVLLQPNTNNPVQANVIAHHEDVEESLSIVDKEKELMIKALKKHRGRRKDAAKDLGISERTLYRKLKEYDLEDL
jgi:DNA-binding NtrC family response regulator